LAYDQIVILAAFVCVYAIAAGALERTPVNGALVFTGFGLLFGPFGFGFLTFNPEAADLRLIAELSLALVLFVEAAKADFSVLKRSFRIPQRLILVALPLVIVLGVLIGWLLFDTLTLIEIAVLATLLAPTDAALGKAVVTNKEVPAEIREGLNFESGLNDGVCVPLFLAFLVIATQQAAGASLSELAFGLILREIGIGAAVGLVLAAIVAWWMGVCGQRKWLSESWMQVPVAALAIACFTGAQALHGSGFIAAFIGGLLFGRLVKSDTEKLVHASESAGDTLALLTWVVFGAAVVGGSIAEWSVEVVIYAVCSLTVIRMLPVFVALTGLPLTVPDKLFIGWFGPRGLASVVFAVMVFAADLPGGPTIIATAVLTIVLSVVAHGLSAPSLIGALARTR
jgi:NhaP-type Na+/H+ or K+/H+ antiporter